jgi:glutaminase
VSKPFTAALIMAQQGPEAVRSKIGVEPTGLPFNSKVAIEIYEERSGNPMVNAGAIAAVSLVEADSEEQRWNLVLDNIEGFAGKPLSVLEEVYTSEYETAWGNRAIANLLYNYGRLYAEPEESLRVYTRQCSIGINTLDLAMMGATLANEGVNPTHGPTPAAGRARAGAAGDHGHGRLLRRVGRLDVQRRAAVQDRRRRRHRLRGTGASSPSPPSHRG